MTFDPSKYGLKLYSVEDLAPPEVNPRTPIPGNIFTDFMGGLSAGVDQPISDSIAGAQALGTEFGADTKGLDPLKEYFRAKAQRTMEQNPISQSNLKEHPFRRFAWSAGQAAPALLGAAATTVLARKPLVLKLGKSTGEAAAGVLGASTFAPQTLGSFYDEARQAGLSHKEAFDPAVIDTLGQVALETLPLTGLLKGGKFPRRVLRGILQEGLIEEGSQQLLENQLKMMAWKGYDNFIEDAFKGVGESVIVGSFLGGMLGAVMPENQPTLEMMRHDAVVSVNSAKQRMVQKAIAEGKPQDEIDKIMNLFNTEIDKISTLGPGHIIKLAGNVKKNQDLFKSLIEVSPSSKEGTLQEPSKDTLNNVKSHETENVRKANDLIYGLDKNFGNYSQTAKDIMTDFVANRIEAGVAEEEISRLYPALKNNVFNDRTVYLKGTGKEGVSGDLLVEYMGEEISLSKLAEKLKNVHVNENTNKILRFSLHPSRVEVRFARTLGENAGLTTEVKNRLISEYNRSSTKATKNKEILGKGYIEKGVTDLDKFFKGNKKIDLSNLDLNSVLEDMGVQPEPPSMNAEDYGQAVSDAIQNQFPEEPMALSDQADLYVESLKRELDSLESDKSNSGYYSDLSYRAMVDKKIADVRSKLDDLMASVLKNKWPKSKDPQQTRDLKRMIDGRNIQDVFKMFHGESDNPLIEFIGKDFVNGKVRVVSDQLFRELLRKHYSIREGSVYGLYSNDADYMVDNGRLIISEGDYNAIVLNEDYLSTDMAENTFLHEYVHGISDNMLSLFEEGTLNEMWHNAMVLGDKALAGKLSNLEKSIFNIKNLYESFKGYVYEKYGMDSTMSNHEGLKNIREFVAYGTADPEFIRILNNFKLKDIANYSAKANVGNRTIFQEVVDLFKDLINYIVKEIGIKKGSVAERNLTNFVDALSLYRGLGIVKKASVNGSILMSMANPDGTVPDPISNNMHDFEYDNIVSSVIDDRAGKTNDKIEAGPDYSKMVYDRLKAVGDPKVNEVAEIDDSDPRSYPAKTLVSAVKWLRSGNKLANHLQNFFGKEAIDKFEKKISKKDISLEDDIVSVIYGDKMFRKYAIHAAWDQMRPVFKKQWEIAQKKVQEQNPQASPAELKRATQEYVKKLDYVMDLALEEIYSEKGKADEYAETEVGIGGKHRESPDPDRPYYEGESYARDMKNSVSFFLGEQSITDVDLQRWSQERDTLSFFNLLGKIDPELQKLTIWTKAEVEHPLLAAQMTEGVFHNADMWKNISKGYSHRVWKKQEEQEGGTAGPTGNSVGRSTVSPALYRTKSEFHYQTMEKGLQPIVGMIASQQEYIFQSLLRLQQATTLNTLSVLIPWNENNPPRKLIGFEDNDKVNEIISNTKYVEYKNSPTIQTLSDLTGKKEDKILLELGYVQEKGMSGLAQWSKGSFKQPYVISPLGDLINNVFVSKGEEDFITGFNKYLTAFKRTITIQPFDSTFLWMTGVILNTPMTEQVGLYTDYFKALSKVPEIAGQMKRGEYFQGASEDYENLPLFMRNGWNAASYEQSMSSIWDREILGKYPELNSPQENIKELAESTFGINAAIFQHYIAKKIYGVLNARYKQFLSLGLDKETAARRAVTLVNDQSYLLNPDVFGKEGKFYTMFLFTRNLTVGFLRQLTALGYPIAKKLGFKHKAGKGGMLSSVFHGEISASDLDFLSRYYYQHIMKVMLAGVLLSSLVQYALSFEDDDEPDENGEIARGNLLARKRFMAFNEPGKRFTIRTPWKNQNQQRAFLSPQLFREARHMGEMLGGLGAESIPSGMRNWLANRVNTGTALSIDILRNKDNQGEDITNRSLELRYQVDDFTNYILKSISPLGIGIKPGESWKGHGLSVDVPMNIIQLFGVGSKYGMPAESGWDVNQLNDLRKKQLMAQWRTKKAKEGSEQWTAEEALQNIGPDFTSEQAIELFKKKTSPAYKFFKANKKYLAE